MAWTHYISFDTRTLTEFTLIRFVLNFKQSCLRKGKGGWGSLCFHVMKIAFKSWLMLAKLTVRKILILHRKRKNPSDFPKEKHFCVYKQLFSSLLRYLNEKAQYCDKYFFGFPIYSFINLFFIKKLLLSQYASILLSRLFFRKRVFQVPLKWTDRLEDPLTFRLRNPVKML